MLRRCLCLLACVFAVLALTPGGVAQALNPHMQLSTHCVIAAEDELQSAAVAARDAKAAEVGRARATVVGGYDPETGEVVAGCSSNPVGCAEDDVTRQLGGDPSVPRFTQAVRPRTGEPIPVCARCQGTYVPGQFPPGTLFTPGGPWTLDGLEP